MNQNSIIALTAIAATFITICSFQRKISITEQDKSVIAKHGSSYKLIEQLRQRVDELGNTLDRLWCNIAKIGSTGGFCLTEENINVGGNAAWDVKLCQSLEKLYGKSSVVDLGAGLGNYGKCFLRRKESIFDTEKRRIDKQMHDEYVKTMGDLLKTPQVIKSWDGYDGAINVGYLSKGFIKQQDLSIANLWLGRTWDWVLSLEIGEHIPPNYEDAFMDNVVRHGCKGIVLSWAVKRQPGHHHVNNRNNDYIKKKMMDRGLVNDEEAEKLIRKTLVLSWLKKTVMVFRYPDDHSCEKTIK